MKRLTFYFARGLIVLLPIVTTIWVLETAFHKVDDLFPIHTPGLGFALAVVTVTLVGWLATLLFGRWLERVTDWVVGRIPLVRSIYGMVKDLLQAVSGETRVFSRPVVVTLQPGGSLKVLGFITRDDLAAIGLPGEVAVLLQQSLNFAGNIVIVPKEQVRPLAAEGSDVMTFVMSGGLTGDLAPGKKLAGGFPELGDE